MYDIMQPTIIKLFKRGLDIFINLVQNKRKKCLDFAPVKLFGKGYKCIVRVEVLRAIIRRKNLKSNPV